MNLQLLNRVENDVTKREIAHPNVSICDKELKLIY